MNLIGKRTGINDHMMADRFTKVMWPDAVVYDDIINGDGDTGPCIKNRYVTDEWMREWIKCEANKLLGKQGSFYVYNVDYDDVAKPTEKYLEDVTNDETLYERSNGVMYFDFDNINKDIVEKIRDAYNIVKQKHRIFQWMETSWSGEGCHIRLKCNLKFKTKAEWMFIYFEHLHLLMDEIQRHIDYDISNWFTKETNIIDWSCATITRGFAIPYNEKGVDYNDDWDPNIELYDDHEDFVEIATFLMGTWNQDMIKKITSKLGKRKANQRKMNKYYSVVNIDTTNIKEVDGERFDYNWRLKCVTTLMNLYDCDKDKVRLACKYIYSFIKPYKNHTYEEMLYNELENKIFRNANFSIGVFNDIIKDLNEYFGFEFEQHYVTNKKLYLSEFHINVFDC